MKLISKTLIITLIFGSFIAFATNSFANGHEPIWELQKDQSSISFFSVKKGSIGEVHSFVDFSGNIDHNKADINIETATVDMLIPIRNERAVEHLFKSKLFPTINIKSDVRSAIENAKEGLTTMAEVPATLSMNGITKEVTLSVSVTLSGPDSITVSSAKPVIISAVDYGMDAGIAKLGELASVDIATSVPVNFVMTFKK